MSENKLLIRKVIIGAIILMIVVSVGLAAAVFKTVFF